MHRFLGFSVNDWMMPSIVMALAGTCLFYGVTYTLHRATRRGYFAMWNLTSLAFALAMGISLGMVSLPQLALIHAARCTVIGAAAITLFWSAFQLCHRPRRWHEMLLALSGILVWNVAAVYRRVFDMQGPNLWLVLPMHILMTAACVCTAYVYVRERSWNRGARLVGFGLVAWGATTLLLPFATGSLHLQVAAYISSGVFLLLTSLGLILEEEIGSSEEKYRALFDSAKDAIFVIDLWTYEIIDVNKAGQQLAKSEASAMLGSSFLRWCPDLARSTSGKEEQKKFLEALFRPYGEFTIACTSGDPVRCEGELKPVRINERSALQLTIRELPKNSAAHPARDRADNFSSLGQLVATVAHELNNPLAAAMGCSQHLAKDPTLPPKARSEALRVFNETERAAKILTNVLNFIRPTGPQFTTADLNRVVLSVLDHRKNDLEAANVRLETRLAPDLKKTKADTSQLSGAFSNLLSNAIQSMEDQSVERVLTVTTSEHGFYIRIAIGDSGPGLSPELQAKIFEPFFTTRAVGKGTGLGLTVARNVVDEHRGKIWVESQPGQGATFNIEVPIVPCEETAREQESPDTGFQPAAKTGKRQLLLVDDEPGILEALSDVLAEAGYEVETAQNGKEAIERIGLKEYDLIMSDMHMPQMDGRQLYESVRGKNPGLAKRIVFLTGDSISSSSRLFLEQTGNRWLCKPFGMQEVEEVVRDVTTRGPIHVQPSAVVQNN